MWTHLNQNIKKIFENKIFSCNNCWEIFINVDIFQTPVIFCLICKIPNSILLKINTFYNITTSAFNTLGINNIANSC